MNSPFREFTIVLYAKDVQNVQIIFLVVEVMPSLQIN